MAKSAAALLSLFLTLNHLLFFTVVSSASATATATANVAYPPKDHVDRQPAFPSSSLGVCSKGALELGACAILLKDLLHLVVGSPATIPCCALIDGLVDLEAAVCLCTVIKANIIGINIDIPVSLNLLINSCGKTVPIGYQCK